MRRYVFPLLASMAILLAPPARAARPDTLAPNQLLVEPRFEDGLWCVGIKAGYGLVDGHGRLVLDTGRVAGGGAASYRGTGRRPGAHSAASIAIHRWTIIDKTGKQLLPPTFESLGPFSEGLAAAMIQVPGGSEYRWGYIDRTGRWVVPARYKEAGDFHAGLAAVNDGFRWHLVDKQGKRVL